MLKAGASSGPVMMGTNRLPKNNIPKKRMNVVTSEEAPMARVVTTSASSLSRSSLLTRSEFMATDDRRNHQDEQNGDDAADASQTMGGI